MFGRKDVRDGRAVVTADTSHLSAVQLEVLAAYQAMQQAMVSADHDAMRSIVEDGTTFTHMSGYTQTKEEFISEVGGPLTYYHSDIREVDVRIDGDWATLTGIVALQPTPMARAGPSRCPCARRCTVWTAVGCTPSA